MSKDKGKNLQKFEFDTFKNYRGRWKKISLLDNKI